VKTKTSEEEKFGGSWTDKKEMSLTRFDGPKKKGTKNNENAAAANMLFGVWGGEPLCAIKVQSRSLPGATLLPAKLSKKERRSCKWDKR